MLLKNGRTSNPLDPMTRAIKEITGKKTKTDEDYEKLSDLEFEASLYWDDEVGVHFPAENIKAMFYAAAKKIKMGRQTHAILLDHPLAPIVFPNHKNLKKLAADPDMRLVNMVVIQKRKTIRTRAKIPAGWTCTFTLLVDEAFMNLETVEQILEIASIQIGCGDWRPGSPSPGTYGTFVIESIEELKGVVAA